jgi:hypothetical protein
MNVRKEERQFVPLAGQGWTTLEALRVTNCNAWRQHEAGLIGIGTEAVFRHRTARDSHPDAAR